MCQSPALEAFELPIGTLLLAGEGLLLVEDVVLPPTGAAALCLSGPTGLLALLGLDKGLPWTLLALCCLAIGEGLLCLLP